MKKILLSIVASLSVVAQAFSEIESPLEKSVIISQQPVVPPHMLVIFGGGGDLTKRKLIPALVQLAKKGLISDHFGCIAIGRRTMSVDQFRDEVSAFISESDRPFLQQIWNKLFYISGEFESDQTYELLGFSLDQIEMELGTGGNRLFYLATPEVSFAPIVKQLQTHRLLSQDGTLLPWSRVIVEKPFGRNLNSARLLQHELTSRLGSDQIFLIDHYLGKEVVHGLLSFRFANPNLFVESFWNNSQIDHVSILLSEDIGIESRGDFWEQTGMLRDMVQNHAMQLVSLIGMEKPQDFSVESIRFEKLRLLDSIRSFSPESIEKDIVRGQYGKGSVNGIEVRGYQDENGVNPHSAIETYVAATLYIDNDRWRGVPFYIKAGKRLSKKLTEIVLSFKPNVLPVNGSDSNHLESDKLIFRIQPQAEIYWLPNVNDKDFSQQLGRRLLESDAYERLFYEAMQGDSRNFVSIEEHLASWRIFTPVLEYWEAHLPENFPNYAAGSLGP